MAASALRFDGDYLLHAGGSRHLRMLPPRTPLPQRRRLWLRLRAVRVSSREGGGRGGVASAVEKRAPEALGQEEKEEEGEGAVKELELRWPPWEGLAEKYKLIGATSIAFIICNMDKVIFLLCAWFGRCCAWDYNFTTGQLQCCGETQMTG
jgi:MFS transporter, ACS family, solute carrier family 17 (sodium-dependent inorganic phosphate cotransporter), other